MKARTYESRGLIYKSSSANSPSEHAKNLPTKLYNCSTRAYFAKGVLKLVTSEMGNMGLNTNLGRDRIGL